jgi:hypothetical protein
MSLGEQPKNKITPAVLRGYIGAMRRQDGTFMAGGRTYTVTSLHRKIRDMMSPSDYTNIMEGSRVRDVRKTKSGKRPIDVMFAKDGALVSKSKKKTTSTKKKKGHSKYSCGLFK